jgi:hypothetical protein
MPVYVFPSLVVGIGGLRTRLQGKRCFTFRGLSDEQVQAITDLTRAWHDACGDAGILG